MSKAQKGMGEKWGMHMISSGDDEMQRMADGTPSFLAHAQSSSFYLDSRVQTAVWELKQPMRMKEYLKAPRLGT
jgi:hypothetical protein